MEPTTPKSSSPMVSNSIINGNGGNDRIYAGGGNDTVAGGAGDDTMFGEDGNDTFTGGTGNDTVNGDRGNGTTWTITNGLFNTDLLAVSDGRDIVNGGIGGTDTFVVNGNISRAETTESIRSADSWRTAGITGLRTNTEIVITRNGTNNASVIAELDEIKRSSSRHTVRRSIDTVTRQSVQLQS